MSMAVQTGNLFQPLPEDVTEEHFEAIVAAGGFRLERIVSHGQATPAGAWYDQPREEWVVLLSGAAGLRIEGEPAERRLGPGDWVRLPAHCRHRVDWTARDLPTVWLAIHYSDPAPEAGND